MTLKGKRTTTRGEQDIAPPAQGEAITSRFLSRVVNRLISMIIGGDGIAVSRQGQKIVITLQRERIIPRGAKAVQGPRTSPDFVTELQAVSDVGTGGADTTKALAYDDHEHGLLTSSTGLDNGEFANISSQGFWKQGGAVICVTHIRAGGVE